MALSDDALVSLEEVKRYHYPNMDMSKSQDDDLLEDLIDYITDQFEKYCEVDSFHDNSYTEYADSINGYEQFVKNTPINSITTIWNDPDWLWGDDTTATSTDYRIKDDSYITFKYGFYEGNQNLKITYNGGYTEIPGDLKLACIKETARAYKHRQDFDMLSNSLDDGSETVVPPGLMLSTTQVLDKYKRIRGF